jgi:lauroyl/myristoyl acyltransferase
MGGAARRKRKSRREKTEASSPISVAIARAFGWAAYYVWPIARRAGMMNLHRALGLDRTAAAEATHAVFANMAQRSAEGIQYSRWMESAERSAMDRCEDPELEGRILADPRPRIFVTAHLGWITGQIIVADGGMSVGFGR